jgi:hypothetical protein
MDITARSLLNLYKFPLGRSSFALRTIAERARALGWLDVEKLALQGVAEVQRCMTMVLRFRPTSDNQYPPEATEQDSLVDRTIGGVYLYLESQINMYGDMPIGLAAARIQDALLPDGVGAVTQLAFTEQHEQVNVILAHAKSPDLADDVALLPDLTKHLACLDERNDKYGQILRKAKDGPTRQQIKEGRDAIQERIAEVGALILGQHAVRKLSDSSMSTKDRDHLLQPILEQNEAIRQARRRNRPPTDVDPETGEEIVDSEPPATTDDDPVATSDDPAATSDDDPDDV